MKTQQTLPFIGPNIPQPDTYEALSRLESAHETVEWFRRDKVRQMKVIKRMLQDDRIKLGSQIKAPTNG